LHCVSTYPPKDSDVNLNNINTLRSIYPEYPIGFSDHTIGSVIPLASASLGACLIEKHFTLDKEMEGWDHKVSATQDEMTAIVDGANRIVQALGSTRIFPTETDEARKNFRRSIVVTRDMHIGDMIKAEDIDYKRPGGNFEPEMTNFIIGRVINKNIEKDHILTKEDIV